PLRSCQCHLPSPAGDAGSSQLCGGSELGRSKCTATPAVSSRAGITSDHSSTTSPQVLPLGPAVLGVAAPGAKCAVYSRREPSMTVAGLISSANHPSPGRCGNCNGVSTGSGRPSVAASTAASSQACNFS